jgi:hypothetical protein
VEEVVAVCAKSGTRQPGAGSVEHLVARSRPAAVLGPLENRAAAVARKLRRLASVIEAGGDIQDLALSIVVLLTVELSHPRWPAGEA